MSEFFTVRINGKDVLVKVGTTVAAAVLASGQNCRVSISGQPRSPLCGMGICFECRMTVAGRPHTRTCQVLCEPGMEVLSDG